MIFDRCSDAYRRAAGSAARLSNPVRFVCPISSTTLHSRLLDQIQRSGYPRYFFTSAGRLVGLSELSIPSRAVPRWRCLACGWPCLMNCMLTRYLSHEHCGILAMNLHGTPPLNDTVGELDSVDLREEKGIGWTGIEPKLFLRRKHSLSVLSQCPVFLTNTERSTPSASHHNTSSTSFASDLT